jgi:hypothetical protein
MVPSSTIPASRASRSRRRFVHDLVPEAGQHCAQRTDMHRHIEGQALVRPVQQPRQQDAMR